MLHPTLITDPMNLLLSEDLLLLLLELHPLLLLLLLEELLGIMVMLKLLIHAGGMQWPVERVRQSWRSP